MRKKEKLFAHLEVTEYNSESALGNAWINSDGRLITRTQRELSASSVRARCELRGHTCAQLITLLTCDVCLCYQLHVGLCKTPILPWVILNHNARFRRQRIYGFGVHKGQRTKIQTNIQYCFLFSDFPASDFKPQHFWLLNKQTVQLTFLLYIY